MENTTVKNLITSNGKVINVSFLPPANIPSFFAFSLHKAGSTLMYQLIKEACNFLDVFYFEPEVIEFENGLTLGELDASIQHLFEIRGYAYSGFRQFPKYLQGFDLKKYPKVLLVRDPRDILVSHYFSQKFSHEIAHGELGELQRSMRTKLQSLTVDQYAIRESAGVKKKFNDYLENVIDTNTRVFRYEDVVFNKLEWIAEMFDFLKLYVPKEMISGLARQYDERPAVENPKEHVRKVTPGDHKEKLNPGVIEQLNIIFADILDEFSYERKTINSIKQAS